MKRNCILCFLLIQLFCLSALGAEIRLPAVFTDYMVLQQNSEVTLWGWGTPSENISIMPEWLNGDTIKTQVTNIGKWSARIRTVEAGGPYKTRINGFSKITLSDVMIGEVWLCSGQSNMDWAVNHGINNGDEEARMLTSPIFVFFIFRR